MMVLLGEYAAFSFGYFLFAGTNALFLSRYKGFDATSTGVLLLVSSVASKATRVLFAGTIDKLPSRALTVACAATAAVGYLSLAIAGSALSAAISLILIGIGYATNSLLVRTLVAQGDKTDLPAILRFASLSICTNAAAAIGPFVGLLIFNHLGEQYPLMMAALATLVAIPLVSAGGALPGLAPQAGWKAGLSVQLRNKQLLLSVGLTTAGWFLYSQLYTSIPLYVGAAAGREWLLGSLFTLNAGIVLLATFTLHKTLSNRKVGLRTSMVAAFALYGLGSLLVGLVGGPVVLVTAVALWTIGEILLLPALQAHLAESSPPENRAVVFAMNAIAMGVGEGLGGLAGAKLTLAAQGGAPSPRAFLLCAALSGLLAAGLLWKPPKGTPR